MTRDLILQGKNVVITGAGDGLGRSFALEVARLGASVVVNDLVPSRAEAVVDEIVTNGGRAIAHIGSIATWNSAKSLVDLCVDRFGAIDGLVNNAGVSSKSKPWETDEGGIRHVVEVNLLGTLYCGRHALAEMVKRRSGSIVNLSSVTASGGANSAAYAATKGGILSATYSWALSTSGLGVRVNALVPSARTTMAGGPDRRPGPEWDPDRVAPVVAYLLSDLSADVSGQALRYALGGLAIWAKPQTKVPVVFALHSDPTEIAAVMQGPLRPNLECPGLSVDDPIYGFE